jgi:dTDP-glucose 4,6-dehydratase
MQGPFDGKHAVVTGGAGFVGSWVCEALLEQGARVTSLDDLSTGRRDNLAHLVNRPGFVAVEADVCEPLPVEDRVDLVMHLACPASPSAYLRMPVETLRVGSLGTFRALELAAAHGARFVLASTSEVYGDPLVHPQPETYWGNVNPVGPRSVYDEAKRFSEAATAAYRRDRGLDAGIARIFNTYGPRMRHDDGRAVPAFASQAMRGEPLTVHGDGTQTRSLCFVADTVRGLLALARSQAAGPVNIGNDHEITVLDLARAVRDTVGSSSPIMFVDLPEDDPHVRRPDIAKARQELDWRPATDLADGLRVTLDWFAAELEPAPVVIG